jgi:outer membrane protein TolC
VHLFLFLRFNYLNTDDSGIYCQSTNLTTMTPNNITIFATFSLLPILLGSCALTEEKLQAVRKPTSGSEIRPAKNLGETAESGPKLPGSSGQITVEECVEFALEKNFAIRIAKASEKSAVAGVARAQAEFDPTIGGSVVTSDAGQGWSGATGSGGIAKKFVTGTEVRVEAGDVYGNSGDFRDDYLKGQATSDLTISVRQPLLRGANWGVNRTGIKLAELLKEQATAAKTAEVLDMLRAAETAYWTAAVAREVLDRQQVSLQRAEKLHGDVKARLDAGDASQLDVLEADVALAGAQERLVAAERSAADRLDEMWFVLGVPVNQRPEKLTFPAIDEKSLQAAKPNVETSTQSALTQSPAAVLLVNEVQRREVELRKARNGLLPQVDLELNADHVNNRTSGSGSKSSGYDAVALIRVSMPLTFRAERADLARAQAELERSQASREQAELRLRQRVAELCRALSSGGESLRVAKLSLAARQKKIEEEVRRHAEGLLSTHDLRIAQEELDGAELNELQARLALLGNQAALGQLDGNLAGRHGISL